MLVVNDEVPNDWSSYKARKSKEVGYVVDLFMALRWRV